MGNQVGQSSASSKSRWASETRLNPKNWGRGTIAIAICALLTIGGLFAGAHFHSDTLTMLSAAPGMVGGILLLGGFFTGLEHLFGKNHCYGEFWFKND